jgi:hypothetical protein
VKQATYHKAKEEGAMNLLLWHFYVLLKNKEKMWYQAD